MEHDKPVSPNSKVLRYSPQDARKDMNLALDGKLVETSRHSLKAYLAATPQEAALYDNMQNVDWMLNNAPTVQAPTDFASKFMAALAEVEIAPAPEIKVVVKSKAVAPSSRLSINQIVILSAVVVLPLFITILSALQLVMAQAEPIEITDQSIAQIYSVLSAVVQSVGIFFQSNYGWLSGILAALTAGAALSTFAMSAAVVTNLMPRPRAVVYRIPVQML